jgi:hypothetical protein
MVRDHRDAGCTDYSQRDPLEGGVSSEKEGRVQCTYQKATSDADGPTRGETGICKVSHNRFQDTDNRFTLPFLNALWRKYSIRRIRVCTPTMAELMDRSPIDSI